MMREIFFLLILNVAAEYYKPYNSKRKTLKGDFVFHIMKKKKYVKEEEKKIIKSNEKHFMI